MLSVEDIIRTINFRNACYEEGRTHHPSYEETRTCRERPLMLADFEEYEDPRTGERLYRLREQR